MIYAPFWRRFPAYLIDIIIIVMFFILTMLFTGGTEELAITAALLQGMAYFIYTLYFHSQSGQTIGKRLLKIKVVNSNGDKLTFKQSIQRNAIIFFQSLPWIFATIIMIQTPESLDYLNSAHCMWEARKWPDFYGPIATLVHITLAAQLIVFFLNKKNQSLHDLIANTVVIVDQKSADTKDAAIP